MSKDFPQFSEEETVKPSASSKPKRTGSVVRGRKPVAEKKEKAVQPEKKAAEVVKAPVAEAKIVEAKVGRRERPATAGEGNWEEAVPESVGGGVPTGEGGNKRKRRRRKGKGGGASAAVEPAEAGVVAAPSAPAAQQAAKVRLDPEALAKAAWKIYLAEVSEEGVALIGDQDARELARRCFRLAEIFLEERGRR